MEYKHPGDRFAIKARDWNAIADVVHRVNSLGALPGDVIQRERHGVIWAVNTSGTGTDPIEFGETVSVVGLRSGSTPAEQSELRGVSIERPTSGALGCVGIALERIEPGRTGRVVIHGLAVAKVEISRAADALWGCAEPVGESMVLRLSQTGRVAVWSLLDQGSGEYPRRNAWALVCLGEQATATGVARVVVEGGQRTLRWVDWDYGREADARVPHHDPGNFLATARDGDLATITLERRTDGTSQFIVTGVQDRAHYGVAYADGDMAANREVPLRGVQLFGPRNGADDLPTTAYCLGPAAQRDDFLLLFRDTVQRQGDWVCVVLRGANTPSQGEFAWATATGKPIGGNGPGPVQVEATIAGETVTVHVRPCSSRHTAIFAGTSIFAVKRADSGWDAVGGDLYDDPIGTIRMVDNANNVPQGWQVIADVTDRYLRVGNVAGNVGGAGVITPTHNAGMYAPQSHMITIENHDGYLLRFKPDNDAPAYEFILDAGGSSSHSFDSQYTDLSHPALDHQAITHAEVPVEPPYYSVVLIQRVE